MSTCNVRFRRTLELTLPILWSGAKDAPQELDRLYEQMTALNVLVAGFDDEATEDLGLLCAVVRERRWMLWREVEQGTGNVVALR